MKTIRKRRKSRRPPQKAPDFVRSESVFLNGRNVRRYHAFYGKRKVQISKKAFANYMLMSKLGIDLERRQGGKRGEGTVPGAGHCWPLKCEALACHPTQVKALNERNKKHGINVEYDRKGFAIIPDQAAYRRLMKAEGVHQNNCYN